MNKFDVLTIVENSRKLKQDEVDFSKSKKERNQLGQFSTPRGLADDLLAYAKMKIGSGEVSFFDPAFGMGSFYTGLLKNFGIGAKAVGFEIDSDYFLAAKNVWSDYSNLLIKKTDFVVECLKDHQKFNLIVCNPPYIRHQHLDRNTKNRLKLAVRKSISEEISGLAGLHTHYMLLCHDWLEEEGLAVWLVPSEILEVNYGKIVRNYLLRKVELSRIHFFEHSDAKFDDALVSSCVIVYKKSSSTTGGNVEITLGPSFLRPTKMRIISKSHLAEKEKWSKHLLAKPYKNQDRVSKVHQTIGDVFSIKRGIATGNNNFFILDKKNALNLEIPKKYLRNVVPSSRYLKGDVVKLDEDGFLDTEKKLVLLDVDLPFERIKKEYPKLYQYLKQGIENGIDKGYLSSRRQPWYSHEKRGAPSYFVRYMNREAKKQNLRHSIFIKNESDAVATNSYLMLYERPIQLFAQTPKDIWPFLQKGLDKSLYKYGRTYGGGLVKFEPNELKAIPLIT